MVAYLSRRRIYMAITLAMVSVLTFIIIQLPPGDYLSTMVANLTAQGVQVDQAFLDGMRERYGLGDPIYVQYFKLISNILLHVVFGQSFEWNRPVTTLIFERMGLTLVLSVATLLFIWAVAFRSAFIRRSARVRWGRTLRPSWVSSAWRSRISSSR